MGHSSEIERNEERLNSALSRFKDLIKGREGENAEEIEEKDGLL